MSKKSYLLITLLIATTTLIFQTPTPSATPTTTLSIEPQVITGLEIGDEFTLNITITDVIDLYAWQLAIYYKSAILNATGYTEGPFLKKDGAPTFFWIVEFTDDYNETHGKIFLTATRTAPAETGVNGSGTLATVSFKTKAYGNTLLYLNETKLTDSAQPFGNPISHEIVHGRVHVGLIDIAIINVQAPISVPKGNIALINVTVENQGRVTQTFDVTLHYNTTPITTQTVTDLAPTQTRTLTFPWDTTPIPVGDYTLTATATELEGETDLEDNTYDAGIIYVGRRNIAIINTHTSKTVTNDTIVYINVTVTNDGEAPATFNLTAHIDTNPIQTKTNINLPPATTTHLIFLLDTTPLPKGIYTISVTATQIPGETYTQDNTLTNGIITETILGDVDGNFEVNILDISKIAVAWQTTPGDPTWNPNADLDNNNLINILDMTKAAVNFGQKI
ncbi:MAG: CARDB domain-containing protein [Candidatus Bathyarchaeia archaeon]